MGVVLLLEITCPDCRHVDAENTDVLQDVPEASKLFAMIQYRQAQERIQLETNTRKLALDVVYHGSLGNFSSIRGFSEHGTFHPDSA